MIQRRLKKPFWLAKRRSILSNKSVLLRAMRVGLEEIRRVIEGEMREFDLKFRSSIKTHIGLLDQVMKYVLKSKGKQIRPILVFLSAGACGSICESTYRGAMLVELLHTATLLHDDVVDESNYRRSFLSVNAVWKNKIAVLAGDFLLSRGVMLSVENNEFELLRILTRAVQEMSEGELLQIEKARHLDITEEVYYKIIGQKTASLVAACCGVGASSAGAQPQTVEQMIAFGRHVGVAFQLSDDLFDYGEGEAGKPIGIDISNRKMTLPLIYALSRSSWLERRRILGLIKSKSKDPSKIRDVVAYVRAAGGIEYAQTHMGMHCDKACAALEALEHSPYKEALEQLVCFTAERVR